MSTRRQRIDRILADGVTAPVGNASLWFDKFIPDCSVSNGNRMEHVQTTANIAESPEYARYYQSVWNAELKAAKVTTRTGRVANRLSIGLGSDSVIETSISLHRLFGVPIIPGSSIKGLMSHFVHQYGDHDWKIGTENHNIVFGSQDSSGYLNILDALYVPRSAPNGKPLLVDVMTTHHPRYYSGEDVPPADWDSPNPVAFLSACGDYLFAIQGPSDWVELAFNILHHALWFEGIGAKTSSGYGRVQLSDAAGRFVTVDTGLGGAKGDKSASVGDSLAEKLIARVRALRNNDVAGAIAGLAAECEKLPTDAGKKQAANEIRFKLNSAGRLRASHDKGWFKSIEPFMDKDD